MSVAQTKLVVIYEITASEGKISRREAIGRPAEALLALYEAGAKGCTALELSSWALRLASYIYDLRHKHELDIATHPEAHNGGLHARYELLTPLQVVETHKA